MLQEQQLQRKLSDLQFEKDMLEAKVEEERAKASLNVYEEFENQCRKSQYRERLAELIPEEPFTSTWESGGECGSVSVN